MAQSLHFQRTISKFQIQLQLQLQFYHSISNKFSSSIYLLWLFISHFKLEFDSEVANIIGAAK